MRGILVQLPCQVVVWIHVLLTAFSRHPEECVRVPGIRLRFENRHQVGIPGGDFAKPNEANQLSSNLSES